MAAFTAVMTFSEDVTDFNQGDIAVVGATLSDFTGSGDVYSVLVTPMAIATAVTLNIAADVAMDASGNKNTAAEQAASAFDNGNPTVTISGVPAKSSAAFTVTIAFSENVTGFSGKRHYSAWRRF